MAAKRFAYLRRPDAFLRPLIDRFAPGDEMVQDALTQWQLHDDEIEDHLLRLKSGSTSLAWGINGPLIVTTALTQRAEAGSIVLVASLALAGTTPTTVQLNRNGVAAGSVTIASGATLGTTALSLTVALNDALTPVVLAVGNGAADLTLQARYG